MWKRWQHPLENRRKQEGDLMQYRCCCDLWKAASAGLAQCPGVWDGFVWLHVEARSVGGETPSTEVLKFICRGFFYWLEASGISTKLGDQGLFFSVLLLAGKQLVICITEKPHKDSKFRNVSKYLPSGGKKKQKIFSSPSCLYLPFCLPCLPPFDE